MSRVSMQLIVSSIFCMTDAVAQIEPNLIHVPGGCAEIGTLLIDQRSNPLREVCIDGVLISQYEVTFLEYDIFTRDTGKQARHDLGFGRENRPVIDVNWFDAVEYASWLSDKTGRNYRLPTDEEWEYVARFDSDFGFKYSWGMTYEQGKANCRNCGSEWDAEMTAPVGSFESNVLGVYDMHGNVWEWTSDCYYDDSPKDKAETHCEVGVVRGGSWDTGFDDLVFWVRTPQISSRPAQDIGFRLVMEP